MREYLLLRKAILEHRAKIVGVALLCVAFGSSALTLGRVRGAAIIGQPLDVTIQVQMDAGDDAASLCFDADVFHADARQDANRVRVVVETSPQSTTANARIQSSALVDEPIVTVYLRTGCGQKTTRRYVLLADFPSEIAAPAVPLVAPVAAPATPPAPTDWSSSAVTAAPARPVAPPSSKSAPAPRVKPVSRPKPAVAQDVASKPAAEKPAAAAPAKRPMVEEKNKAVRASGQSRLKLDPLEALSGRVASLESSVPVTPPPPSEEALRDMQRMRVLEGDVKALLALAAKNEANLADLRTRLQKAESERFPNGVIYGLGALVLLCLAAIAYLWNRQRRVQAFGGDWWNSSAEEPSAASPPPLAAQVTRADTTEQEARDALEARMARTTALSEALDNAGPASQVDVSLVEMSESNFDNLMQSGAAHSAIRKQPSPAPAQKGIARNLNSEAVFDIRQQAEFFVSLGQTDQAVRILERQINESDEPNPLVYLDLLSIFHSLSLKVDFRQFREDFNLLFNGRVPEFAQFREQGKSLDAYPEVLAHITALWPTAKVLEVIEACIFRDPWDAKNEPFDLAAFRDLLFLHAVAQSVVQGTPPKGGENTVRASVSPAPQLVTPTYFSNSGNAVPSSPVVDIALPHELDLDLSDTTLDEVAINPLVAADSEFPSLMQGDHPSEGQTMGGSPAPHDDNLLNFDLPMEPNLPGPADSKSVK